MSDAKPKKSAAKPKASTAKKTTNSTKAATIAKKPVAKAGTVKTAAKPKIVTAPKAKASTEKAVAKPVLEVPVNPTITPSSVQKPVAAVPKPTEVNKTEQGSKKSNLLKAAWRKLDDWNVGFSGKVIIVLIIIGVIASIFHAF